MSRILIAVLVGMVAVTGCTSTKTATYSPEDVQAVQQELFDEQVTVYTTDGHVYSGYTLRMDVDSTNWIHEETGTLQAVATSDIDRIVTGRKALRGGWLGVKRGAVIGAAAGLALGVAFGKRLDLFSTDTDATVTESRLFWGMTGVAFGTPFAAAHGGGIGVVTGARIEVDFEEGAPASGHTHAEQAHVGVDPDTTFTVPK